MASGRQTALAIGAGYLLGRWRQRKLAMMLGAAALAGGSGGPVGKVLRQGAKVAGSSLGSADKLSGSADKLSKVSPGVSEITGMLRGELAQAAKAAATAAVTSRIDALSDSLHDRAEALRTAAADGGESTQEDGEEQEGATASGEPAMDTSAAENGARKAQRSTGGGRRSPSGDGPTTREGRRADAQPGSDRPRRPAREAAGNAPPVRRAAGRTSQGR